MSRLQRVRVVASARFLAPWLRSQSILSNVSSSCHPFSQDQSWRYQSTEASDPTEQRSPPTKKVLRLADEITSLSLLEVSDLTALIKKKLGIPDVPMMPMMGNASFGQPAAGGGAAAAVEEKVEEKTQFDVKLEKFDPAIKLKVIKEVRAITGLGLKESKELVEKAPVVFKKGVSKEEADAAIEKLKAVGAPCSLE